MRILYRYTYQWGDSSQVIFDLNKPASRSDLQRVIQKLKDGDKNIRHYEFCEIKRTLSSDEILQAINSYPQHDPS